MIWRTLDPMRQRRPVKEETPRSQPIIAPAEMQRSGSAIDELQREPWKIPAVDPVISPTALKTAEHHREIIVLARIQKKQARWFNLSRYEWRGVPDFSHAGFIILLRLHYKPNLYIFTTNRHPLQFASTCSESGKNTLTIRHKLPCFAQFPI